VKIHLVLFRHTESTKFRTHAYTYEQARNMGLMLAAINRKINSLAYHFAVLMQLPISNSYLLITPSVFY